MRGVGKDVEGFAGGDEVLGSVAAAQIARDLGLNVVGTASENKRALVETLGATLVPSGDGVADRIREIIPDGARSPTWSVTAPS